MGKRTTVTLSILVLLFLGEALRAQPPVEWSGPGKWWNHSFGPDTGNATESLGVLTVNGGGPDIYGATDGCHYVFKQLTGDGSVTARVVSIGGPATNEWRKAGVMIRQELTAGSINIMMEMTPTSGHAWCLQYRTTAGGNTGYTAGGTMALPYWVRLVRQGNLFTGYVSPDGVSWATQGTPQTIAMTDPVYLGLAVTSHETGNLCQTVFDSVSLTGKIKGSRPDTEAAEPTPLNGATDVPRDTTLSWTPGGFAGTHDVYLGTVSADVNTASRTDPRGALIRQGQDAATCTPGRLAFGTTYYWRVDEVNAPPSGAIFKGPLWSFTTEPLAYPLDGKLITATASSAEANQGPQNTVNGSGLTGERHGNDLTAMWLSASNATGPAWIQYEFAQSIKLHEMWVWNHNGMLETMLGLGAKEVTVEYSSDGTNFQVLGTAQQFTRATGQTSYVHNTTVAFGDIVVKAVKLTIKSNWGGILPQYGLSEVRFLYIPVVAREPSPAPGAANVVPHVTLSWRAGREAGSHQVFLGTDPNHLTVTATVQEPSYEGDVNLDQTYYWKIAEVNQVQNPTTWTSEVWSFSTQKFLVVEDFESYTDDEGKAIWQTWIDGYGIATNGSQVGNANPPYAEKTIILGGGQAMPLFYSNTAGANYSEAERTFAAPQDWTKYGCKTLALSFYGDPNNTGQLYLKIDGTKIPYNGQAEDLKRAQWQPWNIDLAASGANLKSVTKIAIGIDGAGAAGAFRFDEIRLYPTVGATTTPIDPGKTGLVAWYKFDGDFKDSAGTYVATAVGDAKIVNDLVRGQVVSLDGTGDGVAVPLLGSVNTLTVAMWANTAVDPVPLQFESFFHANGWEAKDLHWRYSYGKVNAGINGVTGSPTGVSIVKASQWNHVAVTVSPTEFALWLNGLKEASVALTIPASVTLGEGMIGAWLGTDGTTITRGFAGKMDDVRFYNRALSAEELGSLAGRTGPFAKPF